MRTAIGIVTASIFFLIAVLLAWNVSPYNPFYAFNVSVYTYFPYSFLFYPPLLTAIVYLYMLCVKEGSSLDDDGPKHEHDLDEFVLSGAVSIAIIIFMIPAIANGVIVSSNFERGCYQVRSCGSLNPFIGLIGTLASMIYVPSFVILMTAIGFYVGETLPAFTAGVIALNDRSNFKDAVERTIRSDRPDQAIERELATIMRENMINDRQVEELVSQLSPLQQWVKRVQYRKRMRDAKRLREMMVAKVKALREEGDLSQAVHEMEGVRRERDERGARR